MATSEATRQILWNISHGGGLYLLLVPTLIIFFYGCYLRIIRWRQGTPLNRYDRPFQRIKLVLQHVLLQPRISRKFVPGLFHRVIVWGMLVLLMATIVVMIEYDLHVDVMQGPFYLYFQSLLVDLFGLVVLIGLLMAAYRRWKDAEPQLVRGWESNLILAALLAIVISGYLLEGWRIAATDDPWGAWSPVGYMVAKLSLAHYSVAALKQAHQVTWWLHLLIVYALIAWVPYSKLMHIVTAALNTYTANLDPIGANLKYIDVEDEDTGTLGVNRLNGFTWKDLLDLDACTGCGRCTENCPAAISGKELSSRDIILDLRLLMARSQPVRIGQIQDQQEAPDLFKTISPKWLWQCTTCAACVEACPVFIEQFPKIIDMRRYLTMEEAETPETMLDAVMSMEDRGHPFRGTRATRMDWTKGLDVPLISEKPDADILLWVGSAGALVERSQKVTRAVAQLLIAAKVNFAILGREEKSTGDLARRVGNEFLFQSLATENIETLGRYGVKNIVTSCPHAYNTLANEYPRLGGDYNVMHYTEYLRQLILGGRIRLGNALNLRITYHDPCYLSRHNHIVDAPRELLQWANKQRIFEMDRNRRDSFCCGGGGGMSFAEEEPAKRVNRFRARQVLDTGAEVLAVACPYCMTMMEDGIKNEQGDRNIQVLDIAELMVRVIQQ